MTMLGQGVYRLSEVIQYTGLPASTVRAWFKWRAGKNGRGPLFQSDFQTIGGDYAVSFLNLIDACVAGFLREQGVSPAMIRRAYVILQAELHTPHPFAHADLRTDGDRIIRQKLDAERNLALVDVVSRQMWFSQMRDRLKGVVYAKATRLAQEWNIARGVIIRPDVGFGRPVIKGTGIATYVVANQYRANGNDAARVAGLFNLKVADVRNAVRFESGLKHQKAA
jgi:uncharacterized protein (DUF433 family)